MSESHDVARTLAAILRQQHGLRPATPMLTRMLSWTDRDTDTLAIDLDPDQITIRVIATALPLPENLRQAERQIRAALAETAYAEAGLRLIVADIDAAAVDKTAEPA